MRKWGKLYVYLLRCENGTLYVKQEVRGHGTTVRVEEKSREMDWGGNSRLGRIVVSFA